MAGRLTWNAWAISSGEAGSLSLSGARTGTSGPAAGLELGLDAGGGPRGIAAVREQQRDDAVGERRDEVAVREPAEHGRLVLGDVRGEGGQVGGVGDRDPSPDGGNDGRT